VSVIAVVEQRKLVVARRPPNIVESGMILGLGTGPTVTYLLPALATRRLECAA
jgi:ribose 5-phosphate isomerase